MSTAGSEINKKALQGGYGGQFKRNYRSLNFKYEMIDYMGSIDIIIATLNVYADHSRSGSETPAERTPMIHHDKPSENISTDGQY